MPSDRPRLPPVLLATLLVVCAASLAAAPAGPKSWMLEVGPGLVLVAFMVATYRRFPLSHLVYVGTFVHVLILVYGGMYTYALTPLGNWAKEAFHLSRNHYDRVGHLALGFFPALFTREVLLRKTPLTPGGWLSFLVWCVVFAVGAFWELIEWWTTSLSPAMSVRRFSDCRAMSGTPSGTCFSSASALPSRSSLSKGSTRVRWRRSLVARPRREWTTFRQAEPCRSAFVPHRREVDH